MDLAQYIIFDDVEIDKWSAYKQWVGAQKEFTLTDKYCQKETIVFGKPCIVLMNESPFSRTWDSDWIVANCFIVNVIQKLF